MIDLSHKTIEELSFKQIQACSMDSQKQELVNSWGATAGGLRQILQQLGVAYINNEVMKIGR